MPTGSLFPDFLSLPSQIHQTLFGASESEPQLQYLSYDMETTATKRRTTTAATTTAASPIILFPSSDEAAKCNLTPGGTGINHNES